ncbi:MAG: SpoIIE family protein phosphatase [Coriobacteriia bacterium]|nr:SpoIIE family protein phosphatase [Coriobacteriia bacterium]
MRRRWPVRMTLTNRLLLLAAVIVVATTVLLLVTSAAGVYDMAVRQQSARQSAYCEILVADIGGRLGTVQGMVAATAGEPPLAADDPAEFRRVLSSYTLSSAQHLEGMVLIDADGTVLQAWPDDVLGGRSLAELGADEASATVTPFLWVEPSEGQEGGALWALVEVERGAEESRLLMGRIRTDFVGVALTEISELEGAPAALVLDAENRVLYQGEGTPDLRSIPLESSSDADRPGTGELRVEGQTPLVGPYVGTSVPEGLDWKIAVIGSPRVAWQATWAALMPGVLGWVAALAIALIAALVVVSRMTQPLKELEKRAKDLASGVAVETETVVEHDEVGRLIEAFNSVVRRLNRTNEIAELLARASDRSLVLAGVTSAIAHMLGAVDAEVLLIGDGDRLELVAAEGVLDGRSGIAVRLAEVPWIQSAIASGQPVEASRDEGDPYLGLHGPSATAALAAPLRAGSDIIGVAVVVRHGSMRFTESETETVRTFAAQASVALQNSRLFEDERRSRREAEVLRAIAERIASPGDVEQVLDDVARMQAGLIGLTGRHVLLTDPSLYGIPESEQPTTDREWLSVWSVVTAEDEPPAAPVCVDVISANPDVLKVMRHQNVAMALLTPLYRGTELAGLIVLTSKATIQTLSDQRMALAGTVGKQASLALENAYLFQQAKSRADNLETIFRISHAVGSSLQSRIVLNRVLDVVQKILSADAVMLMTYDAQRKHITVPMARGILHRDMLEATFRPGEDVPGRVFETREPERYDRISTSDTRLLNAAAEQGLESLLAVPLLARGRSIGVLVVFAREPAAFTTDELDLLRTFGSQAALAIDTADMFSREHNVATVLQESILPTRLPHIPGIEASSVYLPAGTDADIGGDYYDLFTAPDGRVVVSIGDVCGKGVAAATKTSMIRYALRGMVVAGLEPARVLSELNAMLLEAGDATSIVTLWLGYIDTSAGTLLYADGGHPPGLLLQPSDARIERLATTGALLGAVSGIHWTQKTVALDAGATLLLYTDGVTEARSGGRFFGEGRVRRALRAGGRPASVAQRLLGQVQRFSAGELRDDAAILAVAYAPGGDDDDVSS